MKKSIFMIAVLVVVAFILVGCEFTSSDYSAICDDNNENCNEYNYDYDNNSSQH